MILSTNEKRPAAATGLSATRGAFFFSPANRASGRNAPVLRALLGAPAVRDTLERFRRLDGENVRPRGNVQPCERDRCLPRGAADSDRTNRLGYFQELLF